MENTETTKISPMKVCPRCGRNLPITDFHKSSLSKDGLQTYCKDCKNELARENNKVKRQIRAAKKLPSTPDGKGCNEELAGFKARDLIAELAARGYRGELTFEYKIQL